MKTPQWLKLSLRDLFWLILVVGMGLGWYADRVKMRHTLDGVGALLDELDEFSEIGLPMPTAISTRFTYRGLLFCVDARQMPGQPREEKSGIRESAPAN
jgi:hypothetical protein